MKKAYYIAEISLPNKSAYAQHVLKMCDNLANNFEITLFVINHKANFKKLKKEYLLKNKFKIHALGKNFKNNLFNRLKLGFFVKKNVDEKSLIISRSIISSLILSISKIKNFLEIHHDLKSFTKVFFQVIKLTKYFEFIYFILINKELKKVLNIKKKLIILDDAVDINDFTKIKETKNKYQFTYAGSLFPGKGIELIYEIAKIFPLYKFNIFGDHSILNDKKYFLQKNLIFHGFISYKSIVQVLRQSRFLLLPYSNKISVNSGDLEVSKFISPLKLFQYLAAKKVIIASNLKAYKHILKNKHNCILNSPNNIEEWENSIKNLKKINSKKLSKNSFITAKKYTWNNRVKKIINIFNERRFNAY